MSQENIWSCSLEGKDPWGILTKRWKERVDEELRRSGTSLREEKKRSSEDRSDWMTGGGL